MQKLTLSHKLITKFLLLLLVGVMAVVILPSLVVASEDSTPPGLTAFSISPTTINTENNSETLTLGVSLIDDLTGVCISGECETASPVQVRLIPEPDSEGNHNGSQYAVFVELIRDSGDEMDGDYTATLEMPRGSMNGNWVVHSILLADQIGNEVSLDATEILAAVPGATGLVINNTAETFDDEGPEVTAFALSPTTFSTEDGSQLLTLEVSMTDDMSGVCTVANCEPTLNYNYSQMRLTHSSGQVLFFTDFVRDSGDALDGSYTATATLPQNVASGEWVVESFIATDTLGNSSELNNAQLAAIPGATGTTITNTSPIDDTEAPTITSFSITPVEVNTQSEDQTLTLEIGLTDDLAGVCISTDCGDFYIGSQTQVRIQPLVGSQMWDFYDLVLAEGDHNDGVYTAELTLPAHSKEGIWEVTNVLLVDKFGNTHEMPASTLANLPGAEGITIVNTASATSVMIDREWTITGESGSVTFPEGTEVTRDNNGSFAFYQMINQPFDVNSLPSNNRAAAQGIVGVLRTGIPNLNLEFSQPITIALNVSSHLNGRTLLIQSMRENGSTWNNETTCEVSESVCTFTVSHATHFLASTELATDDTGGAPNDTSNSTSSNDSYGAPDTGLPSQNMMIFASALVVGFGLLAATNRKKLASLLSLGKK
jgi:hypothetical protein